MGQEVFDCVEILNIRSICTADCEKTRGNGLKLKKKRFRLRAGRKFFVQRLPKEAVGASSLEIFKARLDGAQGFVIPHAVHSRICFLLMLSHFEESYVPQNKVTWPISNLCHGTSLIRTCLDSQHPPSCSYACSSCAHHYTVKYQGSLQNKPGCSVDWFPYQEFSKNWHNLQGNKDRRHSKK